VKEKHITRLNNSEQSTLLNYTITCSDLLATIDKKKVSIKSNSICSQSV